MGKGRRNIPKSNGRGREILLEPRVEVGEIFLKVMVGVGKYS